MMNNISILAIDPAQTSGWCIWSPDGYHDYGIVNVFDFQENIKRVDEIVDQFVRLAKERSLSHFVVAEKWTRHGLSNDAYAGLCSSWGVWKTGLVRGKVAANRIVRVFPQTWRSRVLGKHIGSREQLKVMSMNMASRFVGEVVREDNEADAICIARWGQHSMEVAKRLPKRAMKVGAL